MTARMTIAIIVIITVSSTITVAITISSIITSSIAIITPQQLLHQHTNTLIPTITMTMQQYHTINQF